jgi:RNA polymerase sigma factor (sigma-70 family)
MTDTEIIECLRHNKYTAAIKGLYSILSPVKKYITANSGSTDDAKDIFQDALVILYKKAQQPGFVLTAPLQTYLVAVAKNCWLQELRRRKKLPAGELLQEVEDEPPAEEPGFAHATVAFNLLGEKCRLLLLLFYYKQKSFKEIARALSFSDERVAKNQKYRCLEKAKENFLTLSTTHTHG